MPQSAQPEPVTPAEVPIETVGWAFLKNYYGSYTTDIGQLYTLYDAQASVSHEEFPSGDAVKTVHVARGSDTVRAYFEKHATTGAKNKIVVESATFQHSVDGGILIVVAGSWKQAAQPLWQFVQTFVLRSKAKNVYDVANDVLKFVDLGATVPVENVSVVAAAAAETAGPNGSETAAETAAETVAETAPEQAEPAPEAKPEAAVPESAPEPVAAVQEQIPEQDVKSVQDTPQVSEPPQQDEQVAEAPQKQEAEQTQEPETAPAAAEPYVPAQKPTWASLAATSLKNAPKPAAVSAPIAAKPAAAPAVAAPKKVTSPSQVSAQAAGNGSGKYKKEEWYPIYIKNVEVDDDELKAALIKSFGDIKFFKRSNRTALVDFKVREDQQKALEAKELLVRSNVILLEPRLHKTYNNGSGVGANVSGNAKPDSKKDKKPIKKSTFKKN